MTLATVKVNDAALSSFYYNKLNFFNCICLFALILGMNDLCSPMVVLFDNEGDAFWCFERLMRRLVFFYLNLFISLSFLNNVFHFFHLEATVCNLTRSHLEEGAHYLENKIAIIIFAFSFEILLRL